VNNTLIDLQLFVNDQLDVKKNSKAGTEELIKRCLPKMVRLIKIQQELIVGHAKYDSIDIDK
jgi:hypothetical protein